MITPLPGVTTTKPGSACHTIPGVFAELVDDDGNVVDRRRWLPHHRPTLAVDAARHLG